MATSPAPFDDERWQQLRAAIAHARQGSFYARHLAAVHLDHPDDFSRLPVTSKQHLVEASPFDMLAVPPASAWHYHESSGTTSEPISTWCGLGEIGRMATIIASMVPEFSAPDAMLLNRFPSFAPVHFLLEEVMRRTGRCHIASGSMSWDVPFGRALGFLRKLPVTILGALPLEAVLLREAGRELGVDVASGRASLRAMLLGGAVLPPAFRRWIEHAWQVRVVEIYGSNETMLLGISCLQGKLHFATDLFEAELLDPATHAPVPVGAPGVLTVTSLAHEVMPLVRYLTGDLVQLDLEPCGCGVPTPTGRVLGRAAEVATICGRSLTPYALLDACYEFVAAVGARVFFVVLLKRGIELLVETPVPKPATTALEEVRLGENLGVPVTVQWLADGEVLDRSALFRTPKIYKPSQVSDWRAEARQSLTVMEALIEWPKFDLRTVGGILRREVKNARRRRRLAATDR